jgi:hypothetical protein
MVVVALSFGTGTSRYSFCDFNAYLCNTMMFYAIDLASGNSILVAADITTGNIARPVIIKDGYIWGYLSSPSRSIVRVEISTPYAFNK